MNPMMQLLANLGVELKSRLSGYDAFGKHSGEKGERRENAIAEMMQRFLPGRFRIVSGEVVSAKGEASRQVDVLIVDAWNSPTLCDARDTKIVPAESVYAAIEVKPDLKSRDGLVKALENIRSVKRLPRDATLPSHGGHHHYHGPAANPSVYAAIITYGDCWDAKRIGEEMYVQVKEWPREEWPDQICVCGSAVVLYGVKKGPGVLFCRPHETTTGVPKMCRQDGLGDAAFGFFLLELLYHIGQMDLFPADLQKYLAQCGAQQQSSPPM